MDSILDTVEMSCASRREQEEIGSSTSLQDDMVHTEIGSVELWLSDESDQMPSPISLVSP